MSTDLAVLVNRGMAMLDSPVKPANDVDEDGQQ